MPQQQGTSLSAGQALGEGAALAARDGRVGTPGDEEGGGHQDGPVSTGPGSSPLAMNEGGTGQ